jgi:hypothetical protein
MAEDKAWQTQMLAEIIDTKRRVQASEAIISAFTVRGPSPLLAHSISVEYVCRL